MLNALESAIMEKGIVLEDHILKVDMFLNHQIDIPLIEQMGRDFYDYFKKYEINKVLTVEASGIAIACFTARCFGVPVVFAKKGSHKNVGDNVYSAEVYSYTKGKTVQINVSKEYLNSDDKVLFVDDFLANGAAANGVIEIIRQSNAQLMGVGIAIEKGFQAGGKMLLSSGIDLYSLAIIDKMEKGRIYLKRRELC